MTNINFIYGKTADGKLITLDGFKVESFAIYEDKDGETFVDIYFKSGAEVSVYAYDDEHENIPDCLADCMLALKENPDILTRPYPVNLIECDTVDWVKYFFDGNAVEYHITDRDSEEDLVELHFASGNVVEVRSDINEDLYPGESVETLVDDCICRYFKDQDYMDAQE